MDLEPKLKLPPILWIPLIIVIALIIFVDVFQNNVFIRPYMSLRNINFKSKSLTGFEIKTPGCKIPAMDPWDENVRTFISDPETPTCNKGVPALFEANLTSVYYVQGFLPFYGVSDINELECCYKVFWRVDPNDTSDNDNQIQFSDECYNLTGQAKISDEFIEVKCLLGENMVYQDMFSFVPLKNISRTISSIRKPLNVLLIGLDAVSRLNLHRQMPETLKYLKEIEAVELLGYNKVADNTFPNLIPVLTGMSEGELKNSCWPNSDDKFDDCHFIWEDYKEKGYVTLYGEDSSWMGLFNFQRKGFKKQPTDYGYSYFNRKAEEVLGNSENMNVKECVGARLVYKESLKYVKKFYLTMDQNDLTYFALFWGVSLSHDYLNQPKLGDLDYRDFFKGLKDEGHLDNTVLIFMSDHGIRWGDIRETYQGRMEERLPFVIIRLPKWYRSQFQQAHDNLVRNVRRLTTPFDLHETLVDLLRPFELGPKNLTVNPNARGISLFRQISDERTCETAGISSHWCTCQQSKQLSNSSTDVTAAAKFALQHINGELQGYAQCAVLKLQSVLNARLMMHDDDIGAGDNKMQDYMLTITTVPGNAIFEVTVRHSLKESLYEVIGTIGRLNLYGKQSACIMDYHLKLYCYCKNLLE